MAHRPRMLPLVSFAAIVLLASACNEDAPSSSTAPPVPVDSDASSDGDASQTDEDGGGPGPADVSPVLDVDPIAPDAEPPGPDTSPPVDAGGAPDVAPPPPDDIGEFDGDETIDPPPPTGDLADPWETGPYSFVSSEIEVPDAEGTLDADLYLPTGGPEPGPYPVVIFNHGFQLNGEQFASYGEHLASHGFIAILPTTGDSLIAARTHVRLAEDTVALVDWIVAQAAGVRASLFDADRIAAGGHSRGGKQAIFAATRDDRIRASFNVDPVDAAPPSFPGRPSNPADYPSVAPELMSNFRIPGGFVGAGLAAAGGGFGAPACAPEDENYAQYFNAAAGPAWSFLIEDAGHLEFADSCGFLCRTCRAGSQGEWVRAFSRAAMVAFYQVHLRGDDRYETWLTGDAFDTEVGRRDVTVTTRNVGP